MTPLVTEDLLKLKVNLSSTAGSKTFLYLICLILIVVGWLNDLEMHMQAKIYVKDKTKCVS